MKYSSLTKKFIFLPLNFVVLGVLATLLSSQLNLSQEELKVERFEVPEFLTLEDNTLFPYQVFPSKEEIIYQRLKVIVTGYSSSIDETDSTPFITASGTYVREGVVANNLLPFGTKIKIPELFGEKIFVVEDRLNPKKGYYHVDVWFPSKEEALNFGAHLTYIEILPE